jgi:MscS family membrane protein
MDFLEQTYYGNTPLEWFIALLSVVGALIVGKIIYWVIGRFVKRLTAKTTTRIDDLIVDMVEEPIVLATVIIGFWYSTRTLTLTEQADLWVHRVIYVLVIINVAWAIARTFDAVVEEYLVPLVEKSEADLDDQLLPIARRGVKAAIWIVAIIVALNNAGYDVGALLAGLGIGGLAFALAAQDTVSNLFGSFTIFTDRPFTVNDRIQAAGVDGTVVEIGMRSTRLKTLEGRIVTIPNSKIAHDAIVNVSSEPARKVVMTLGLTYDMSADQMHEAMDVLGSITEEEDDIDTEELKPAIAFTGFGDFSMNILFVYWIKKGGDVLGCQTRVNTEILKRFTDKGLDMAFPTQTILHQEMKAA